MTPYFLVYAWILLTSTLLYINKIEYQKARKCFCFLSFFAVFLIFALRHPFMGGDLRYGSGIGYLGVFTRGAKASWQEILTQKNLYYFEKGYTFFTKLIAYISDDHQFFFAACAAVSLVPVGYTVYRQSKQPDLSLYIFMGLPVFTLIFSGVRQAMGIGICVLALLWVMEKKPVRFILTVLLAMSFHKSAALFFVAYPVYHVKMNKPLRWITCALPFAVYVLRFPLFALAGKVYSSYAVPDYNGSYRLFAVFYLVYLFCCIFSEESEETSGLKNLYLIACCVQAMSGVHSIMMRAGFYFMAPLTLLLPAVLSSMKNGKLAVLFKVGISICFIAFGLYSLRIDTAARSYPYFAFWEW